MLSILYTIGEIQLVFKIRGIGPLLVFLEYAFIPTTTRFSSSAGCSPTTAAQFLSSSRFTPSRFMPSRFMPSRFRHLLYNVIKKWADRGIEPRTTRTQSEYHTTRPVSLLRLHLRQASCRDRTDDLTLTKRTLYQLS